MLNIEYQIPSQIPVLIEMTFKVLDWVACKKITPLPVESRSM
jgi:hypothetical protein